jgi:Tfp pilus assembly protein PilF
MDNGDISISPVSISRYHRLGGGDIDKAILHEVLIPQVLEQNGLKSSDLTFEDKRHVLEPLLLNAAETLKISLCEKISGLTASGEYWQMSRPKIKAALKETFTCKLTDKNKDCKLVGPELDAFQFEKLLTDFLDTELLYARDTEYRMTNSVFSPVTDCLDRSGTPKTAVDAVLMAGGSALIPQVREALGRFLPNAAILTYPDSESARSSVSRGAAYHALALALTGKGIITPVCHEGISILTEDGPIEIIPKGMRLPYPACGYGVFTGLMVPEQAVLDGLKLRVELVTTEEEKFIFSGLWNIMGNVVNEGDPIRLEYRFDENRNLWLRLTVDDGIRRTPFNAEIENPVTQVMNPSRTRVKILELEEDWRTGTIEKWRKKDKAREIAKLYVELGQKERAVSWLKAAIKVDNQPDFSTLTDLGNLFRSMGNLDLAMYMYREAARISSDWGGPLFNLALAQKEAGKLEEAMASADEALKKESDPPYKVLKGWLLKKQGKEKEARQVIQEAIQEFKPVSTMNEWEVGWYNTAAEMAGDTEEAKKAQEKIQAFARTKEEEKHKAEVMETVKEGVLPMLARGV